MKAVFILAAAFLLLNQSYAVPDDSVFVVISGDTVHIWNTAAFENCGCLFRMNASVSNDTITVTEVDTSANWAFCMCYFDLSASITGLQSGTYLVNVYRYMPLFYPDTVFYVGSTSFIYGGSALAFGSLSFQSDCYELVSAGSSEAYPSEFRLEQNYPNPFNPVTTINYQLPKTEFVTLKVYDVLCREVATLVNAQKSPGVYSVDFDASDLGTGVYFYRIKAGNSVQTKKMILLR